MNGETIHRPAAQVDLDPRVEPGIEATIGAPLRHWVLTAEDVYGRIVTITPDDQLPNISHDLALNSLDRLS